MKELDEITIKLAAKGKLQAFRKVYDHYSNFVWKVVYRTVNGDEDSAQLIMQNVFIKVYNDLKSFKFHSSFSTWLYRITYNETMAYLKKLRRRQKKECPFVETINKSRENDPLENKEMVSAILHTLSAADRFLLIAREVNNIPFEDLADITGKSSGALRTMLHRIKESIRKGFDYETGRVLSQAV